MPLIDVLIPAYNAAGSLGRAIRSLQAQSLPDWRAVIVDDGSTDDTAAVVRAFGDERLLLVSSPRNLGRGRARTLGLSQCTAPYVALLDADDWCLPERLGSLVDALASERNLGYVGSASAVMGLDGQVVGRRGPANGEHLPAGWQWTPARLFHPTLCLRREVLRRAAYSTARYSEDFIMLLHLCRLFNGRTLGEALYVYEEGSSQTARKYALKSREVARVLWQEPDPLPVRLAAVALVGAKVAAFGAASLLGLQSAMLKERTEPVDEATGRRILHLREAYGVDTL
jgi:hypothetical protein